MILSELTVFIVVLLMGYRTSANTTDILLFIVVSILFAFAITLLAIPFSLKAKGFEGAGGFSYILLMLLFVSSALMPMNGMVKPVKLFAEHQPMTSIVETARNLLNNSFSFNNSTTLQAFIWLFGIIVIFGFFSYRRYQKVYSRA
ncbi:ABC transporter permease [Clostridium tyrobutyricum]|uniref:ABC transporter permease n=1 Tax=Clostridium tyrobutyricum TaxID=1519 RepID=UPI00068BB9B4|nr:ABC transporter permease [Clostridium tyrobutyricum]